MTTPPGVPSREGQKQQLVARFARDPSQTERAWVLRTEAAEGGWGIARTAFGRAEFAALATR